MGGGAEFQFVQPHDHASVLGVSRHSSSADAEAAVRAAAKAAPGTSIVVSAVGPEAEQALDAITELVASKFNEEGT